MKAYVFSFYKDFDYKELDRMEVILADEKFRYQIMQLPYPIVPLQMNECDVFEYDVEKS